MSRRAVLAASLAAGAVAALGAAAPAATALPAGAGSAPAADWFAEPPCSVRPKFRWWWPDGLVDPDEIAREVDQIADAGFGGVEIAAVHHSIKDKSVLDTARHGWGSRPCLDGVEAALPDDWTASHGAVLELGQVSDTVRVTANGTSVPAVDRLHPVVDVGPCLRGGGNSIEIEVATPLINRLRVARPSVFGTAARQDYGLVGPVRLVPYAQAVVF